MSIEYDGGYFLLNEPLVRGYGANAHTATDLSHISRYAVEATNHLQETPWEINPFIKDVIQKLVAIGKNVTISTKVGPKIIVMIDKPISPRSNPFDPVNVQFTKAEWEGMTKEHKKQHKTLRAKAHSKFEEDIGVYRATLRSIQTMEEMSQFEKFYFPHNMDFRTRIYPIPTDLTPQSNDLAKGCLRFSKPMRLGEEGYFWMGVAVASQWGEDKLSMQERFDFAKDPAFFKQMMLWVDDPIKYKGWLKADNPFQFLAVAHEWVWANRSDDHKAFLSKLPGNMDGSCNGAQHLSIMSRDPVGAQATNCFADAKREDLYLEVADRVWEKVESEAKAGNLMAIDWVPKLMDVASRRDVVKRSVMTVPYGVTDYGVADFMIKDKHVSEESDNKWDSAKYLRDHIINSIEETLDKGRMLQRWFQTCAVRCAEANLPMCWDTPAGSKVTQAYRNIIMKRIYCMGTRFYVYEEPDAGNPENGYCRAGMDIKKMGTSAPPNVVHSCDASHLQITTCRMYDAGIKDFSMIHDSFGCHFANVGLMNTILRQSIVDMYSKNYLITWKESVEKYSGLDMPEPPELGDFDIRQILGSEYFFS